jgi:membrane protease YdiL (CAAX protease family)
MVAGGTVLLVVGVVLSSLLLTRASLSPAEALPSLNGTMLLAGGAILVLLGLLLVLVGLGLYVLIPAYAGGGERARRDYGSHRTILACTLLAVLLGNVLAVLVFAPIVAISYFGGANLSQLVGITLSPAGIAVAAFAPDVAMLSVVYLRIVRPGAIGWTRMGLERKLLLQRLLLGLLGGFLLFGLSFVIEMVLDNLGIHQTQADVFATIRHASPLEFGLVLLAGAVVAPIVEEIFFRGFIFKGFLEQKGAARAYLFSAAIFAAVHMNAPAFIPIFAMGLLLSAMYARSGSVIPGMAAHAVNNAAGFILIYIGLS